MKEFDFGMLEILLSTAEELRLVDGVLSVLYQMVLFEDLLASGDVSNSMTHIMAALNMCLRRPGNREPRVSSHFYLEYCNFVPLLKEAA